MAKKKFCAIFFLNKLTLLHCWPYSVESESDFEEVGKTKKCVFFFKKQSLKRGPLKIKIVDI